MIIKILNKSNNWEEWVKISKKYNVDQCIKFLCENFNYPRMHNRVFGIFTEDNEKITEFILIDKLKELGIEPSNSEWITYAKV